MKLFKFWRTWFYWVRQQDAIHVYWIQVFLQVLTNTTHHNAPPVSSKIKRNTFLTKGFLKIGGGGRMRKGCSNFWASLELCQNLTLDWECRRRNWCSLEKLNLCSKRYYLNERRQQQEISLWINILTRRKSIQDVPKGKRILERRYDKKKGRSNDT